jgi:hypothetical protein
MLPYYFESKDSGYYYDKIRLNFSMTQKILTESLPIDDLKKEADYFLVSDSSDEAQKFGLYTKIEMVAPSRKCLEIIDEHLSHSIKMKISKLEIAQDVFFETEREAQFVLYKLLRTIRKKYTSKHFIFDQFHEG